jgi:hypothetical protein
MSASIEGTPPSGPNDETPEIPQEGLTVDYLKRELFVREVPPENQALIHNQGVKFAERSSAFSESLPYNVFADRKLFYHEPFGTDLRKLRTGETAVSESDLTAFGKLLQVKLKDETLFDLGSSSHGYVPDSVQSLQGRRYVGIDKNLDEERAELRTRGTGETEVYYLKDDILGFLSKCEDTSGGVYYLSGIEPLPADEEQRRATQAYQDAVVHELWRVTKSGDLVVIGPVTRGFDLEKAGFQPLMQVSGRIKQEKTSVYIKP